jgi:hypothetical protein
VQLLVSFKRKRNYVVSTKPFVDAVSKGAVQACLTQTLLAGISPSTALLQLRCQWRCASGPRHVIAWWTVKLCIRVLLHTEQRTDCATRSAVECLPCRIQALFLALTGTCFLAFIWTKFFPPSCRPVARPWTQCVQRLPVWVHMRVYSAFIYVRI